MSGRNAIVSGDGWRAAKSLVTLYDQIVAAYPNRTQTGDDATIGDTSHAARTSDHNPNSEGVVCALDMMHDPAHGFDSYAFGDMLRLNKDGRVKYVISNRRIFYGPRSPSHAGDPSTWWKWEHYGGENPHDHHIHISVGDKKFYDNEDKWVIDGAAVPPVDTGRPTLRRGSKGDDVKQLQQLLFVDGDFGPNTEVQLKAFQRAHDLPADGIVGLMTWAALLASGEKQPGDTGETTGGDWQTGITTTVFGGASDRNTSGYDGHLLNDTDLYGSLPFRMSNDKRMLDVRNSAGKIVTVKVDDIGPWLVDDPYWQTGTRPVAETAHNARTPLTRGPNKGRVPNGAGLDLSPAAFRALGLSVADGKGTVDWRFHSSVPLPVVKGAAPAKVIATPIDPGATDPGTPVPSAPQRTGGVFPRTQGSSTMMPTQEQVLAAIRWMFAVAGPLVVSHGMASESGVEQILGAVVAVFPLVWSLVTKTRAGLIKTAAALPDVERVVTTPAIADGALRTDPKVTTQ